MEHFQIFSFLSLYFLFHFLFLAFSYGDYTLPGLYFINCGSASSPTVNGRTFTGDVHPGGFSFSSGGSRTVQDSTSSTDELYQSARIFTKTSSYELDIAQNGTYVVRFHFSPFPALRDLQNANFSVEVSRFRVLSNFTAQIGSNFPHIEEFLLSVTPGKLKIRFVPSERNYFGFVNAIEVFLAPPHFIPDSAFNATEEGFQGNHALRVIHRINVGGSVITPNNDRLLRNWIPDDAYLVNKDAAKNSTPHSGKPNYQSSESSKSDAPGLATEYDAPDNVYNTAKEVNIDRNDNNTSSLNTFNILWRFDVRKGAKHFVRVHFCDIVSPTINERLRFDLSIWSNFTGVIWPYQNASGSAVPFLSDFFVDSDNVGFINISISPRSDLRNPTAFLNGVEIMELVSELGSPPGGNDSRNLRLPVIIGSSVGGLILVIILIVLFGFLLKRRKWKHVEAIDWTVAPPYAGSSYARTTDTTITGSPLADLNLGLKIHILEILYATKNFNAKLMIGEGGFGKVYKGILRNGTKVAVKRSEPGHGQGVPEFQTEIKVLSRIRHQHLVSLIGYCDERDEMILVYEFMEKGTLRDHLYILNEESGESTISSSQLSWDQRLRICIGAAKGIHYLHTGSSGAIIHRDIKSTNILLDEHYKAKVADFGLSRTGPLDQSYVCTDVKGSFGYLDPDYFRCSQLTKKSDVYSFGVVLLEVVCARPVIDHSLPREQTNLADWAMMWQRKGELDKIVDPLLVGKINSDSLRKFGETVEKCLQEYGVDRPEMVDVLWDLEYCLSLQKSAIPREPYEDSTTDVSWDLQMNVVQRLPSHRMSIDDEDSFSVASQVNASEEEKQIDISSFHPIEDATAALLTHNPSSSKNWNSNTQSQHAKKTLWCEFCQTTGHIQAKCFRLHGFPPNWKPKGKRNGGSIPHGGSFGTQFPRSHSNNVGLGSMSPPPAPPGFSSLGYGGNFPSGASLQQPQVSHATASAPPTPHLTPDQIHQLLNLLHTHSIKSTDSTPHLAGISHCLSVSHNPSDWIIDSGATDHITYCFSLLQHPQKLTVPHSVHMPDGSTSLDLVQRTPVVLGRQIGGLYCLTPISQHPYSTSPVSQTMANDSASQEGLASTVIEDPDLRRVTVSSIFFVTEGRWLAMSKTQKPSSLQPGVFGATPRAGDGHNFINAHTFDGIKNSVSSLGTRSLVQKSILRP
ncbi:hypothetical protein BUALT_Bualt04G0106500 [Buddleja alternifolia]|uniref:Protein kinase domain-containing protein n=1 Tax=Buddleja alternifolia TaxID=168488 RepID=A0AAV6XYM3_9LAMI|nr:hypothetical protein BUALT_Bualt04G0106500 [Buddleja alternifolia]